MTAGENRVTVEKPNVLHVLTSEAWGGLELYSLTLIGRLRDAGVRNTLAGTPGSRVEKEARDRGIPFLPYRSLLPPAGFREFSHVHVHRRQDLAAGRVWVMGRKTPLIYSLYMMAPPKKGPYHRWIYRRVSAIMSSSTWLNEQVRRNFPVDGSRVHLVRYGRDQSVRRSPAHEISIIRKSLDSNAGEMVFGTMCRLDEQKGVVEIARALGFLDVKRRAGVRVWIIGDRTLRRTRPDGSPEFEPQSERVYQTLRELQSDPVIGPSLRLVPYQNDPTPYLSAMDAFILGSYEETYSLGVIDAMLLGLPVIGTDTGGTVEQIGGSERGIAACPRSPESIARAFETYLDDPALIVRHGAAAETWARREHAWPATISQVLGIYSGTSSEA